MYGSMSPCDRNQAKTKAPHVIVNNFGIHRIVRIVYGRDLHNYGHEFMVLISAFMGIYRHDRTRYAYSITRLMQRNWACRSRKRVADSENDHEICRWYPDSVVVVHNLL
jgi:hypothetical protein